MGTIVASACGPDWDILDPALKGTDDDGDAGGAGSGGTGAGGATGGGAQGGFGGGVCQPFDDENECTQDECAQGQPINTPLTVGTTCSQNGGHVCDGKGKCVECNTVADCWATDCQTGGMCKNNSNTCQNVGNKAAGSPCAGGVCNSGGACVECITDAQCTTPETCGGGGTPNACGCTASQTCASLGLTCGTGDDGCGGALDCDNDTQDGAETDVDCGGGGACLTKCTDGQACAVPSDCISGKCMLSVCVP